MISLIRVLSLGSTASLVIPVTLVFPYLSRLISCLISCLDVIRPAKYVVSKTLIKFTMYLKIDKNKGLNTIQQFLYLAGRVASKQVINSLVVYL